jgi:hypothetical protein
MLSNRIQKTNKDESIAQGFGSSNKNCGGEIRNATANKIQKQQLHTNFRAHFITQKWFKAAAPQQKFTSTTNMT